MVGMTRPPIPKHADSLAYASKPVIGFYGNGEIYRIDNVNQLLEYACVF